MTEFAYSKSSANFYPNLKIAAEKPFMGLTAIRGNKPYLIVEKIGREFVLEDEDGKLLKIKDSSPIDYYSSSNKSALIAASRVLETPFPRGKLSFQDGEWEILVNGEVLDIEQLVEILDDIRWSKAAFKRLAHDTGDRRDEKNDPLQCPKCNSHTVKLKDREASEFHCYSCGHSFNHEVHFNPKSHTKEAELGLPEVPEWEGEEPAELFAPPPPPSEDERVQQWRAQQFLSLGFDHTQAMQLAESRIDYHDLENLISRGASPEQALQIVSKVAADYDFDFPQENPEEQVLDPYHEDFSTERSSEDDRVLQWRLQQFLTLGFDPDQAQQLAQSKLDYHDLSNLINRGATPEQALSIVSKKLSYQIDEKGHWKHYTPGPDDAKKTCPGCGYDWKNYHKFQLDNSRCPHCGHSLDHRYVHPSPGSSHHGSLTKDKEGNDLVIGKPYLMHSPQYKIPDLVYIVKAEPNLVEAAIGGDDKNESFPIQIDNDEFQRMEYSFEPFISTDKQSWDYNNTTDSMSGHDTGAPNRFDPQNYDDNDTMFGESQNEVPWLPTGMPKHDDVLGLNSPQGSVHIMSNEVTGSQILVMSNGKGGAMGWSPFQGQMGTEGVKWETSNLHEIEKAINDGLYREIPAQEMAPQVPQVMAKQARKKFSQQEQEDLINESKGQKARNYNRLDLSGSHYETKKSSDEEEFIWW